MACFIFDLRYVHHMLKLFGQLKMTKPLPPLPQVILSCVFLLLGGWCLFSPESVEILTIREPYRELSVLSSITIACFGAQAVLASILVITCTFTRRTYIFFGFFGSVPFFFFNYYFLYINPIFTNFMFIDFFGNLGILLTCIYGARKCTQRVIE